MRIPGGIRVRIALALVGIVTAALGAAYLIVIPSLEQRLVDARLDQLEDGRRAACQGPADESVPLAEDGRRVGAADELACRRVQRAHAESAGRRRSAPTRNAGGRVDVENDDVVLDALESGELRARPRRQGERRLRGSCGAARVGRGRAVPDTARGLADDGAARRATALAGDGVRRRSCARDRALRRRHARARDCCGSRRRPSASRAATSTIR